MPAAGYSPSFWTMISRHAGKRASKLAKVRRYEIVVRGSSHPSLIHPDRATISLRPGYVQVVRRGDNPLTSFVLTP